MNDERKEKRGWVKQIGYKSIWLYEHDLEVKEKAIGLMRKPNIGIEIGNQHT